ncbi:MAG: hypothetical protein JWO83_149 [Caulobacteraceae bacterium]|nr:hypothetical protein [Caulobacteraceae bacterium]
MLMPSRQLVWLPDRVVELMKAEAKRSYPVETGGVVLGYRVEDEWVVREVLGPGPDARHHRRYFEPDADWHAEMIRAHFARTDGREVYIGDWHTHPDGELKLSRRDRQALRGIVQCPQATPAPLSALLAGGPDDWALAMWAARVTSAGWFGQRVVTTDMIVRPC